MNEAKGTHIFTRTKHIYLLKPEELIIEKFKGEVRVSQAKRRDNLFQEKDMSSVNTQR